LTARIDGAHSRIDDIMCDRTRTSSERVVTNCVEAAACTLTERETVILEDALAVTAGLERETVVCIAISVYTT
jgi:hypothetical protein